MRKNKLYIIRAIRPNGTEKFFGTYRSYELAERDADNLTSGIWDDAQVEDLDEMVFMSRWDED